ncbi:MULTISPECIES: hypothetical protein [Paenibacillus]|jgi:hypothetical protein|uniref:Uncharacterized protein n=1 Tax=Paenibacillus agaridevorans TaxID=171404 RepID=A0A2R5EIR5_9BACL|nr:MULTISPECIES: hypothetical protein [Paenibacillus]QNK58202.1 hypothetical protein H7F31_04460 [Paenibacillus sp. PAMC21692]GBG06417.1 hypothetical protein PAT3040_00942 [Paenibacillus agaridevorans]
MAKSDQLRIDPQQLADAWSRTLPETMNASDRCEVHRDESDATALRVTIHSAGHAMYEFDFKVTYVDSREVLVELIDVEKDNVSIDERPDAIQQLIHDYKRHIHECAQALQSLTHA